MDVGNGSRRSFCSALRFPHIQKLKNNRFWWFLEVHVLRMLIFGCRRTYSNIFWSILTNDGMWAATCMLGGGRLPPSPPQLLFMRGSAPQTPHIVLYCYLLAPQKDAEWKDVYRNGRMSSSSLTVNWFMTKTWLEIWTQLRTKYVVPSTWYQTLGTKHYNIRSYNV